MSNSTTNKARYDDDYFVLKSDSNTHRSNLIVTNTTMMSNNSPMMLNEIKKFNQNAEQINILLDETINGCQELKTFQKDLLYGNNLIIYF